MKCFHLCYTAQYAAVWFLSFIKITSERMKTICLHLKFLISTTQSFLDAFQMP